MSAFYLASSPRTSSHARSRSSSSSSAAADYERDLPFPQPISRAAFAEPSFSPAKFLSSLADRHQTLADLQSELRGLSQALSAELLDLVNENYAAFLQLGTSLRGGDERVEEARLGVLGFQKDARGIRTLVAERADRMAVLLEEKKAVRREVNAAHDLLDVAACVEQLEHWLMLDRVGKSGGRQSRADSGDEEYDDDDDDDDDDEDFAEEDDDKAGDEEDDSAVALKSLERCAAKLTYTLAVIQRVGKDHPFVKGLEGRLGRIKETMALDLKVLRRTLSTSDPSTHRPAKLEARLQPLCGLLLEERT